MSELSLGHVALVATIAGLGLGLGIMAAVTARAVYTITRGGRWYQLKKL